MTSVIEKILRNPHCRLLAFAAIVAISLQSCGNSNAKDGTIQHILEEQNNAVQQEVLPDSIAGAYLRLDKSRYDFGKVHSKKTQKIEIEFEVENLGKAPLLIFKADVSCGCMSVDYPKMPIHPGKRARITITVNTNNQTGVFNKSIFIKSNADNDVVLIRILGEIEK